MQGFTSEQCAAALEALNGLPNPAIAVLWNTFGTNNDCLAEYLTRFSDRPHVLEVHISNQVCMRRRSCGPSELLPGINSAQYNRLLENRDPATISKLERRISEIAAFVALHRNPTTTVLLSAGLEDDYSSQAYSVVLELLAKGRQDTPFKIVRNPVHIKSPESIAADLLEFHGFLTEVPPSWQGRCIVNNDGINVSFTANRREGDLPLGEVPARLAKWLKAGCIAFLWWTDPQGLEGVAHNPPPPMSRKIILRRSETAGINSLLKAATPLRLPRD